MATPSVAILNHGAADLGIPRVSLSAGWYKVASSMLASFPACILNHIQPDLRILRVL
jgi:hypothetical protein